MPAREEIALIREQVLRSVEATASGRRAAGDGWW